MHALAYLRSYRRGKFLFSALFAFSLTSGLSPLKGQTESGEPSETHGIPLSAGEAAWLKAHPVVRLGYDPAWPPFSFRDKEGKLRGIDFDLIGRIEQRVGIKFEPVATSSWEETDRKVHEGAIDVVSGISRTDAREQYLLFTPSYITCPVAVITRKEAPFMTSLHDLKDVIIASPKGYVTTGKLLKDYPNLKMIQTATVGEALELVSRNKADVAVENLPGASFIIKAENLKNLKIAGITDYRFGLCLAVRKDWPELYSILEKTLASMNDAERRDITDHWTAVEYFPRTDWTGVWKLVGLLVSAGAVIFVIFAAWNRRLARELEERRKAEEALKNAHDRLHELNKEKDRFMRMAAHDLNNPLSSILMKCGVFEMDDDYSRGSVHDLLSSVRNNGQRMSHLIKNLLNADKMEHGKMRLQMKTHNLSRLVREAMENMQPCAECKLIQFDFIDSPYPVSVTADREAMLQVLENLISNAIKFSPSEKSITLRVVMKDSSLARVEVQDQGPGITDEDRPRLFGKYVTLSARPTANESSNGLGLSIAKSLVESMRGKIWCEDITGGGALFVVEFEAVSQLASAAT